MTEIEAYRVKANIACDVCDVHVARYYHVLPVTKEKIARCEECDKQNSIPEWLMRDQIKKELLNEPTCGIFPHYRVYSKGQYLTFDDYLYDK